MGGSQEKKKIMAIRSHIGKVLATAFWAIAGSGVLVLLVAAIRYRNNNTCKGWHIAIDAGALPERTQGL